VAVSQYLIDILTRHQVYLERLKAGEARLFDPVAVALNRTVVQLLSSVGTTDLGDLSPADFERVVKALVQAEERLLSPYAKGLTTRLSEFATFESQFAEQTLDKATNGTASVVTVHAAAAWAAAKSTPVQAVGKLLEPFIRDWTVSTMNSVEATIRNAHAQGWTVDQTVRAVRGTKAQNYKDGLVSGVKRNVEALVRTSIQHVSNTARGAVWAANEDIVQGERWISTLDSRTTQVCRSLDQRVFPFGVGPRPPIHIGCRSTTIPEMKETVTLLGGTVRASRGAAGGAQVPASQTYYEWLKGQPASFQDDAIGVTRGKLFRNGGLSAEEFARLNLGRNFEPLTLAEMRVRAPEAFNRAGIS